MAPTALSDPGRSWGSTLTLVAAVLLLVMTTIVVAGVADADPASARCKKITFIGIPGSNQGKQHNYGGDGYTGNEKFGPEVNKIKRALVRQESWSNVKARAINYPATIFDVDWKGWWDFDWTSYNDSVRAGVTETYRVLLQVNRNCPGTRFVIAGYSQGAEVATEVINAIGNVNYPIPRWKLHRAALVGNPLFNQDEIPTSITKTTGKHPTFDNNDGIRGDYNWSERIDGRTRDVCIAHDNICNFHWNELWGKPENEEHHQYNWRNYPGTRTDITWHLGKWLSWGI